MVAPRAAGVRGVELAAHSVVENPRRWMAWNARCGGPKASQASRVHAGACVPLRGGPTGEHQERDVQATDVQLWCQRSRHQGLRSSQVQPAMAMTR